MQARDSSSNAGSSKPNGQRLVNDKELSCSLDDLSLKAHADSPVNKSNDKSTPITRSKQVTCTNKGAGGGKKDQNPVGSSLSSSFEDSLTTSQYSWSSEGSSFDCCASESEDQRGYQQGGYHPVNIGEVYDGRYRIDAKLGWGYFSTVWLAADLKAKQPRFVAIKFQRSSPEHIETVIDEIRILKRVRDEVRNPIWLNAIASFRDFIKYTDMRGVVTYLDHFTVDGPNGKHTAIVFETMGPNLLSLIKLYKFQGIPMPLVKRITLHVLLGLVYLHDVCGIIHTDLKPENVLVSSPLSNAKPPPCESTCDAKPQNQQNNQKDLYTKPKPGNARDRVPIVVDTLDGPIQVKPVTRESFDHEGAIYKICDLGNACWIHHHFSEEIQTRQYRAPEAILQSGYSQKADIWSLASIIFELVTGDYLFHPRGRNPFSRDVNHLQLIVELLGPIPMEMVRGKKAETFDIARINKTRPWPLDSVLIRKYKMDPAQAKDLSEFLLCMLRISPKERQSAQALIHHKWLHT
ncbi:bifunctional Protein kinase domain/Protein kinase [Babesia duncani]|uniref:non-specific serine/threonine protein kinase n=1 Tax=Babesia duncani TaxID=323732 RepID=A0AAD9UP18_9APIC|nr:bifunctional Protein kinase domain/Protein kinase [Babesia duncani]